MLQIPRNFTKTSLILSALAGSLALVPQAASAQAASAQYVYQTIDEPDTSTDTYVQGINDLGSLVGQYDSKDVNPVARAFVYAGDTFTTLDFPGQVLRPYPYDINNSGQIVGDIGNVGFLDTGGTVTTIEYPGTFGTSAYGINDAGEIVGAFQATGASFPAGFLYSGGVYTTLTNPLATTYTLATDINNLRQIVGNYDSNHGFLYSGGAYTSIDFPGAASTAVSGINDAGQIIGTYVDTSGNEHGFVLTGGNFLTMDEPRATTATVPTGINNLGQVAGWYRDALGDHGYLATPGGLSALVVSSLAFPSSVSGGTVVTATVTLSSAAPFDTAVGLSSSDSSVVRLHRSVIILAGSSSATFAINTYRSHVTKTVTITATLGTAALTKDLTITGR